jgi:hypothetical protein
MQSKATASATIVLIFHERKKLIHVLRYFSTRASRRDCLDSRDEIVPMIFVRIFDFDKARSWTMMIQMKRAMTTRKL